MISTLVASVLVEEVQRLGTAMPARIAPPAWRPRWGRLPAPVASASTHLDGVDFNGVGCRHGVVSNSGRTSSLLMIARAGGVLGTPAASEGHDAEVHPLGS
jgi:hypothetical protein